MTSEARERAAHEAAERERIFTREAKEKERMAKWKQCKKRSQWRGCIDPFILRVEFQTVIIKLQK